MSFEFTLQDLEHFLRYAKTMVRIVPMQDYKQYRGKVAILRHDIDLDINPAFTLADLEESIGIRSTFFVRIDATTYNIFSPRTRKNLSKLVDRGFEVGLHFDPQYEKVNKELGAILNAKFEFDLNLLETALSSQVHSFSLHNPVQHGLLLPKTALINAYSPEIFSDEQYISDSMFIDPSFHPFRGKNPYEFVAHAKKYPIQIVFHPEQFFNENEAYLQTGNFLGSILRFLQNTSKTVLEEHQQTIMMLRNTKYMNRLK